jgi:hypothetical protein
MDAIWMEIRERVEGADMPQSHKELLDIRRARVAVGKVVIHDWDDVRDKVGQRGTQMRQGGIR